MTSDERPQATVGALTAAMDLLEALPPAGPALRRRGYTTESDLIDGLGDPDATVRRGCLELIANAWSDAAMPRVLARLQDPEWEVRYTALHAFTREPADAVGSEVLPAAIETVRTDSNRYVRMLATELVGSAVHGDRQAARTLEEIRDSDRDPGLRRKAGRYAPGGINSPTE